MLSLKDDMVDQQIDNRFIDDAVKNSIVTLSFYQSNTINKEVIANDDPAAYNLSFFKRLVTAVVNGWVIFEELLLGLANLWVFILAGIGIWMLLLYYKGKRIVLVTK